MGQRFPSATILVVCFVAAMQFLLAGRTLAEERGSYRLPQFRQVSAGPAAVLPPSTRLTLLADENFPPFSFRNAQGGAAGLTVDLAVSACSELRIACEVRLLPFDQLLAAFQRGDGEVLLDGPQITSATLGDGQMTRPWFRSLGRFAVQSGNPLTEPSAQALSGKRIGVEKGSSHAAWIETYFPGATEVAFDTPAFAQEALRTGAVDMLFGDNLRLIYWVSGSASRDCCKLLGGAYTDFATFSRNYAFIVAPGHADVRNALDGALDRLQGKGITEKLFNAYVPLSPW